MLINIQHESQSLSNFSISSSAVAAEQMANILAIRELLQANQNTLQSTRSTAVQLRSQLDMTSTSASPYTSFTDLPPVLGEGRSYPMQALADVAFLAKAGIDRYTAIIGDVSSHIATIGNNATIPALRTAVIGEAQDELIEAKPDALSWLSVIGTRATELAADLSLRINNIKHQLRSMTSPSPPFTPYLKQFIA